MAMHLIVGLGNPGPGYAETRHNAGFWFLDRLAAVQQVTFRTEAKFRADSARTNIDGHPCWLLKPMNYMNNSGQVAGAFARYHGIAPGNVLVAHDELDLEVGVVRLKIGGGAGGHNGLKDLIAQLGGDFLRLRFGIAHPGDRRDVIDYVLRAPSRDDRISIDAAIDRALDQIGSIVSGRAENAMNALNARRNVASD
ncbi:MAG: aminoacyl-tRNA hydrolase [Gammaproteobacteria bacterium]|nr:aminoacyl-tRNA hydrolase [Gammaproteobacteria bacterium]